MELPVKGATIKAKLVFILVSVNNTLHGLSLKPTEETQQTFNLTYTYTGTSMRLRRLWNQAQALPILLKPNIHIYNCTILYKLLHLSKLK